MHSIVREIGQGDLVFDVGANRGDKADWFLDRGARVVCVEPQPRLADHLRGKYRDQPRVSIVDKGLSDAPGSRTLFINNRMDVISTFAEHWKQGRFADQTWDEEIQVPITTLDALIDQFGMPRYCKIDVEGHEVEVMSGLTRPVPCLSFEFAGEYWRNAMLCIERCIRIGHKEFNISLGEDDNFLLSQWVPYYEMVVLMSNACQSQPELWGDVYARVA